MSMIIRKCKKSDVKSLFELDRILETHQWNRRSKKNWNWKYFGGNPSGGSIFYVAEFNSKIVACFAAIPITYNVFCKKILASHSIAMMVHPDWQNKGLIKFVADKVFDSIKTHSILFVYGYPNDKAYKLHKDIFEYKDMFNQITYSLDQKYYNLNFVNTPIKKKIYKLKVIKKFDKSVDNLFVSARDNYKICVEKNSKFLNWRYISRPDKKYYCYGIFENKILKGYFVLKTYKDGDELKGHIIDYLYDFTNKKSICDFIVFSSVNLLFKKFKVDDISLWCNGDKLMKKTISKYSFSSFSKRKMICRIFDNKLKNKLKKNNWLFTMGDTLEIY